MKKIVVNAVFNTPETIAKLKAGIDCDTLTEIGVDVYYAMILIDLGEIENAIPASEFKNHTTVQMKSGDSYVLKLLPMDLFRLIDHIDAQKLICKLNN